MSMAGASGEASMMRTCETGWTRDMPWQPVSVIAAAAAARARGCLSAAVRARRPRDKRRSPGLWVVERISRTGAETANIRTLHYLKTWDEGKLPADYPRRPAD